MFVALRDLRFAKGRFALMGTVTVLIAALVGLLSGLTSGLGHQNTSAVTGLSADRIAFGATGEDRSYTDSTVSEEQWRQWARTPGVEAAEPLGIAATKAESDGGTASVSAFGAEPGAGILPQGSALADSEVALSEAAAEELGAGAGERVTLGGGEFTVTAVTGDDWFSHTPVAWTTLDDWQGLAQGTGEGPHATVVALTTDGADIAAADGRIGTDTVERDDSLAAIGAYTSENGSLQLMRGFLFAISALVIGAFFTVWTIQRSADVAVLKALGASTRYLLGDALGQALVLLVAGTAVGTGIAAAVGAAVAGTVPFVLTAGSVLAPSGVLVVLGALGAVLAVRRITSVDPLIALGSAR